MLVLISKRALRVSCLEFLNVVVPDVKGTRSPGAVTAVGSQSEQVREIIYKKVYIFFIKIF